MISDLIGFMLIASCREIVEQDKRIAFQCGKYHAPARDWRVNYSIRMLAQMERPSPYGRKSMPR